MTGEFVDKLRQVWLQAKNRTPMPDVVINEFRRISETVLLGIDEEVETRGPGYIWCPSNKIINGSFETDLTGWTEVIDAGITATTARTIADSHTVEGSLASLEVAVTASTATGYAVRRQVITGISPGEVWSFDMFGKTVIAGVWLAIRIEWLDVADGVLFTAGHQFEQAAGDWHSMETYTWNLTAPAGTAKARVSVGAYVSTIGLVGTVRCDLVRAEQAATISTRLTRPVWNEWAVEA